MFSVKAINVLPITLLIAALVACGSGGDSMTSSPQSAGGGGQNGGGGQKVNTPAAATQLSFAAFNSSDHWFIADRNHGFYRSTDHSSPKKKGVP